ncbi:MAG: hypothetical protein O9327_04975 [Polaromonas sp.]|nr:hypothetical protein [Polaromonas sp.]
MRALSRLQASVICQSVADEEVANKLAPRARQFVVFGAMVAAMLAATPEARAQSNGPLNPSNCAAVGMTVGGAAGSQVSNKNSERIIGAALGALGGAAAGHWLCSPSEDRSRMGAGRDSSYDRAANYGMDQNQRQRMVSVEDRTGRGVGPSAPKAALGLNERAELDRMAQGAIDAKYAWKKSLFDLQSAQNGRSGPLPAGLVEREQLARQDFDAARNQFSIVVAKLNNGTEGMPPKAVGRYIEVSAALLELSTDKRTSFDLINRMDNQLQNESMAYREETQAAQASREQRMNRVGMR